MPTPRSISRGAPVNTARPPGSSAAGMLKRPVRLAMGMRNRRVLPLSRQGYVPLGRTAPPMPVTQAVSPSRRQAPPMARMQSMVASMS